MLRKTLLSLLLAAGSVSAMQAQRIPTATRTLDIQVGGDFSEVHSDYGRRMSGFGFYGNIDFKPHLGLAIDFHQVGGSLNTYERSYEIGGRYVIRRRRYDPYAKLMYGRGIFNFPPYIPGGPAAANLAYNMVVIGGGVDYKLKPYLNIRGDFEYQDWFSNLGLNNGLTPYLGTVGVAYHFR
jgi:hypothetical protein